MGIEFVDVETAKAGQGPCLILLKGVPSPWSQAAKAIFETKGIAAQGVWMEANDPAVRAWTGVPNAPVVMHGGEAPRAGWAEILALAERLAPAPALSPEGFEDRARMHGYAHELIGQGGLIWHVRLMAVELALVDGVSYPPAVGHYLGARYGYSQGCGEPSRQRAAEILSGLDALLKQAAKAGPYYFGDRLTALDIYSAVALDTLVLLPQEQCALHPKLRAGFEATRPALANVLTDRLIRHRDMMHARHMPLPIEMG